MAAGWYTLYQRAVVRRERTSNLFEEFYSPENYHATIAPVFILKVRWQALEGDAKTAYADAICKGWPKRELSRDEAREIISSYDHKFESYANVNDAGVFEKMHFRKERSTEVITEHAALTAFLYFWVKLERMRKEGLLSENLVKQLFKGPYDIYRPFIRDFREAVANCVGNYEPDWFSATQNLESFFDGKEPKSGLLRFIPFLGR